MSYSIALREISQPVLFNTASRSSVNLLAIDMGSGKTKARVSEVQVGNRFNKIVHTSFNNFAPIPFKEDLDNSLDGRLSENIQQQAIVAVRELQQKAQMHKPDASVAVATEFVRQAKNGQEFLQRLKEEANIHVNAITPEEEGILGFLTATLAANTDPENTVVWDSGNGSLQITAKFGNEYTVFCCQLGKVAMLNLFLKLQNHEQSLKETPNPITQLEVDKVLQIIDSEFENFPLSLRAKLSQPNVTVLKVGTHPLGDESLQYSKNEIEAALQQRLELNDGEIRKKSRFENKIVQVDPRFVVPNLTIAYGVMNNLGIDLARYVGATGGNTSGLLLSPQYWKE